MSPTSPLSALTTTPVAADASWEEVDSATFRTGEAQRAVFVEAAANLMAELPPPVRALVRLASSGHADLPNMEYAFEEQPLVAESVLSLARALMSPYQPCETIADVFAVLGPRTLGVLAAASVATGMLERGASVAHATGRAMTIAALCRRVAPIAGASADDASLSGLLCDVGESMLLRQKRGAIAQLADAGMPEGERIDRERVQLGFDHAALGESALRSWGANEDVALAVRYHHDVVSALGAGTRVTRLVGVVRFCAALTRRIADARGRGADVIDRIAREESAAHLPLGASSTDDLCRSVRDAFIPYALTRNHSLGAEDVVLDGAPEATPIPCAVCDGPAAGMRCPCCNGHLCSEHESGNGWCLRCEANYIVERGRPERVLFTAAAATLFIVGGFIASGRIRENFLMREASAVALLVCALATIAAVCVRGVRRTGFRSAEKSIKREKPMRREAATTVEKAPSSASPVGSSTLGKIRAFWAKQEASGTPAPKVDAAKRDSKAMVVVGARRSTTGTGRIRAKETTSSVTKARKTPTKAAKRTSTGSTAKVKKAPAKPRAKRAKVVRAASQP
jgi:HD-like signal output (HDOD) protein